MPADGDFAVSAEAAPQAEREQANGDDDELAGDEDHEPLEGGIHEAVGVQANPKHVHAEPREAGDNVAEDRQVHDAAIAHQVAPAGMEDDRVPEHDEQGTVLLRVPAPEPAPGLIRPDAPQDGADKAEQGGETDDGIDHRGQGLAQDDLRFLDFDFRSLRRQPPAFGPAGGPVWDGRRSRQRLRRTAGSRGTDYQQRSARGRSLLPAPTL